MDIGHRALEIVFRRRALDSKKETFIRYSETNYEFIVLNPDFNCIALDIGQ